MFHKKNKIKLGDIHVTTKVNDTLHSTRDLAISQRGRATTT